MVMPSFLACSSKETCIADSYNVLANSQLLDHQDVASELVYNFYKFYFQQFSSWHTVRLFPYILIHLYVVKYIWEIIYTIYMNQKTIQLTDHDTVRQNIKILKELEVIVTEELEDNANPAKIGMYMKLLWENKK